MFREGKHATLPALHDTVPCVTDIAYYPHTPDSTRRT